VAGADQGGSKREAGAGQLAVPGLKPSISTVGPIQIQIYVHTCIYRSMHSRFAHTRTCMHARAHTCIDRHMHASHENANTHIETHIYIYTYMYIYMYVFVYVYMHPYAYTHIYMHVSCVCINVYSHTYKHKPSHVPPQCTHSPTSPTYPIHR
jgi:hypothetical protein